MASGTPIGALLQTVFESILEVFLLCLAGYILAVKGILDRKTQKQLNRLNVSIFTPSLLFSKVAFFLSPAKLRELWVIPIFFVVTTIVSMIVAYFLSFMLRLKRSQRSFAIAAAMFMNSNSLPIALMQSLVITVPGLKWTDDDNEDAMVGRALTYLVLYSTLGMVIRWSYGVRLLSQADPEAMEDSPQEARPLIDSDETAFPPSPEEQRILHHHPSNFSVRTDTSETIDASSDRTHGGEPPKDSPEFFYRPSNVLMHPSHLQLPKASTSGASSEIGGEEEDHDNDDDDDDELPAHRNRTEPTSSPWQSCMRRLRFRIGKAVHKVSEFMTVPLWAALLSLIVACIPPLQHALDAHLKPIKGALTSAGNCSIPVTLVVLGAYFYAPADPVEHRNHRALPSHSSRDRGRSVSTMSHASFFDNVRDMFSMKRRSRDRSVGRPAQEVHRPGETKTVIVAVLARMIITPLLLLPLMALSARFDLQRVFDDPVFVVSNVLLIASPPALTLAQITQAASGDAFERLISRTIFWSYCVVTPPSVIVIVVIGLLLSKL